MNEQLLLRNIRGVLARLEDTILFAIIERAQFKQNAVIYRPGAMGDMTGGDSLVGYLLHETEKIHARMRRFTSPDEHPFYRNLPKPILPRLRFDESPLQPNSINLNPDIRHAYETGIIPLVCQDGDDQQYGSSSVCDVQCLPAISRRVHFGKFVAESKYLATPGRFNPVIRARNSETLMDLITDEKIEAEVLDRVERKARTYSRGQEASEGVAGIAPATARRLYRDWIMPLNKKVQVLYLLQRPPG
jgi:chorismate mutase